MATPYKKLYRSREHRMVGGVCGGIGEYFEIDPTLIRVLFVVGTLLGWGVMILVYLILLIVVPNAPEVLPPAPPSGDTPQTSA